jgi:hypothetical protein
VPRVAIPVTKATRAGVALTATTGDPVNNHYVANDGKTGVIVENTGATVSRTVTFRLSRTVDGQSVPPPGRRRSRSARSSSSARSTSTSTAETCSSTWTTRS